MGGELVKATPQGSEVQTIGSVNWENRITAVLGQVHALETLLQKAMKVDRDYGKVPGTKRPTLLKPGAEKILSMFEIRPDPIVEDLSTPPDERNPLGVIRYRVKVNGYWVDPQTADKFFKGAGVGEISSEEEKYKWRESLSDKEYETTDPLLRRVKFKKIWFSESGRRTSKVVEVKQIRVDPFEIGNTLVKMGKKRGIVDLALTVSGGSEMFTQDAEEIPDEIRGKTAEAGAGETTGTAGGGESGGSPAGAAGAKDGGGTGQSGVRGQSPNQFNASMKMFRLLGMGEETPEHHAKRSEFLEKVLGRKVETFKSLNFDESSKVITALGSAIDEKKKNEGQG